MELEPLRNRNNAVLAELERIVALEMELTLFNARRTLFSADKQVEVRNMDGTMLLVDRESPRSEYYNRVIGFGPDSLSKLSEILRFYGECGITPCFDLTPDKQTAEVAAALAGQGYVPRLQLAFLSASVDGAREPGEENRDFRIEPVNEDNVEAFLDLIVLSNGGQRPARELLDKKKEYYYRPEFKNWVAWAGEEPAGMASLFLRGEEGYAANDFTFPAFRGRGCQTALIRHRLRAARELGIRKLYADVEFGGTSHLNMLKAGFSTAFINAFWMKTR
ncbi:GNAT family N-acetyltransferase [Paenibacillus sp. alder61]|uniref:GNAT family N-acetyltransferase n=1 Tax=Paenibacillus sp. alder61 TaxID=2862948 RepID=UPI001CD5E07D|nr:GNAT family N-acetyltransferase [Paenibacillus sp. alder61]MCA1296512.1 GNAT family N-acetyltransferase [Paenibacillus sp. alder61]